MKNSLEDLLRILEIEYEISKTLLDQSGEFTYSVKFWDWLSEENWRSVECGSLEEAVKEAVKKYMNLLSRDKGLRERYKRISESDFFKKHYFGKSLGDVIEEI